MDLYMWREGVSECEQLKGYWRNLSIATEHSFSSSYGENSLHFFGGNTPLHDSQSCNLTQLSVLASVLSSLNQSVQSGLLSLGTIDIRS